MTRGWSWSVCGDRSREGGIGPGWWAVRRGLRKAAEPCVGAARTLTPVPPSPAVLRDISERGRDLEQILSQYITFVKPAFEEFCLPVSPVPPGLGLVFLGFRTEG